MNQPNPKLAQAANAKRSKELDAREAYLNEREELLNSGPVNLIVLEKTIKAREQDLLAIKGKVLDAENIFMADKERLAIEKATIQTDIDELGMTLKAKRMAIKELDAQIDSRSKVLAAIEDEVAERQDYLKHQESLIHGASEAGNEQLLSTKFQIEELERDKRRITLLLVDLQKTKAELETSLEPLRQQTAQLQSSYQQAAANLRGTLDDMRDKIAQAGMRFKQLEAESEEKLKILKIHETEILTKREALTRERQQLDTEKRRWASTKGLYQVE